MNICTFDKDVSKAHKGFILNKVKKKNLLNLSDLSMSYSVISKIDRSPLFEHNTSNIVNHIHFFYV